MESQKVKKKVADGRKKFSTFLFFTLLIDRGRQLIDLGHRSRSNDECASLLEDDDEDGEEAADDSAPAAPAPPR